MKHMPSLVGGALLCLACAGTPVQAQELRPAPANVVQLSASGSVEAAQDLLSIRLSTRREAPDANTVQAQLKVAELGPKRLRFKLVLAQKDVAMLIGREGFTAAAIRSIVKATAALKAVLERVPNLR